jgi:predicted HicB family RNase H-like nuclease
VCDSKKPRVSFPLRLAASLKERAEKLAAIDGVSINHFINLAVAEKVSRLEAAKNDTK